MASKAVFNPAISVPFSNLIFMIFQNLRGPSLRSTNGILNHDRNGIDLFGHPGALQGVDLGATSPSPGGWGRVLNRAKTASTSKLGLPS